MVREQIEQVLNRLKDTIINNIEGNNITASGRTQKSLSVKRYEGGIKLTIGGSEQTAPLLTLEQGRPGGKVPNNFNQIIKQWIIDKGITPNPVPYVRKESERWKPKYTVEERSLNTMAGAIAAFIARNGTGRHILPLNGTIYTNVTEEAKNEIVEIVKKGIFDKIKFK